MSYLVIIGNKHLRIPKGQSKINNPEKLATYGTQDEEKNTKKLHNMCWTTLYGNKRTNTNNVNKTWALLQTTGGKDEPMRKSQRTSQQRKSEHNWTTQKS